MITAYLKFPKYCACLLALIISYKLSFYFDKPVKFISVLFFLLVLYIPFMYSYFKNRKINGKRFLQIEISSPMVLGFDL
jgi:uncharacterized membrane protein